MSLVLSEKYTEALGNIPPPGCGCHPYLLRIANYGAIAGHSPEKIHADIQSAIPAGARRITDREIRSAIQKAMKDRGNGGCYVHRKPEPIVKDGKAARDRITKQARITEEADIWESSPIRLWDEPDQDTAIFLQTAFLPDDLVWIGERTDPGIPGVNIKTAAAWIEHFKSGGTSGPFIIINPLSGNAASTRGSDAMTFRGDGNVMEFRFCMAEFDNIPREEQLCFWAAVKLPIIALVDSGGKSIHGWIDVRKLAVVTTLAEWQQHIKGRLYNGSLVPLGVDPACSNPARLSRLPGHFRKEKNSYQKILWLSPEGRPIT